MVTALLYHLSSRHMSGSQRCKDDVIPWNAICATNLEVCMLVCLFNSLKTPKPDLFRKIKLSKYI